MSSKNSNQSPGSNGNRTPKNWKMPNIERHKTTNSLTFEDHYRSTYIGTSPKNSKNYPENNPQKFHRHASEEDFKKYYGNYQAYQLPVHEAPVVSCN